MLFFQNAAAQLTLHSRPAYVRLSWHAGPLPETAVQHALDQVLVALQVQGWQKVLIEQASKEVFSVELQVWIELDWRPRAVQAGYRYGAFVQGRDLLARMATMESILPYAAPWPVYQLCTSEAEAQAWLAQFPAGT
ncbi:hypothetical protein [Hymenobacter sp. YC55]|uniref:hypothetical protein n=1 Tax=Hymenobacter sp. YC55 TaxID=3034019 RepID=UPI0023F62080|nr:hypothetical protein [Hymenobacter sp. YC55]MDF7815717.1 hypothetical protein [Hymenobacter sp. YC55]